MSLASTYRDSTAALVAQTTGVNAVPHNVDPVTAARILNGSKQALVAISFSRVAYSGMAHDTFFSVSGDLDMTCYALTPEVLDATLDATLVKVLRTSAWRNQFEAVDSAVVEYDYSATGDNTVSAARIRLTCQWSEDYQPDMSEYPLLGGINMQTRAGTIVGPGNVVFEVEPVQGDIIVDDDVIVETDEETVIWDPEQHDVFSPFASDGDVIELEPAQQEVTDLPHETPIQEREK